MLVLMLIRYEGEPAARVAGTASLFSFPANDRPAFHKQQQQQTFSVCG